jgi:hypothetical protein
MKTAISLIVLAIMLANVPQAFACGNGTKCCWTECRSGEGCIQRCDSGR